MTDLVHEYSSGIAIKKYIFMFVDKKRSQKKCIQIATIIDKLIIPITPIITIFNNPSPKV